MFLSAFAALVMFAAPEATQAAPTGVEAPAAEAKPAMRRVCTQMELPGTKLPKKTCKMVPAKADAKVAEQAADKASKSE